MTLPELCDYSENNENTMPNQISSLPEDLDQDTKVGSALRGVLQQASHQGRATVTLPACVDLLASRPDDVMLCVMPVVPHADAASTIQSTLIRAVCQEHAIRVLAVDCDVKLAKAVCAEDLEDASSKKSSLSSLRAKDGVIVDANSNEVLKVPEACSDDAEDSALLITPPSPPCDNMKRSTCFPAVIGFPCVLVEFPTNGTSVEDEIVAEFCKEQMYGDSLAEAYIELPD